MILPLPSQTTWRPMHTGGDEGGVDGAGDGGGDGDGGSDGGDGNGIMQISSWPSEH